jgi:hypothetical protein
MAASSAGGLNVASNGIPGEHACVTIFGASGADPSAAGVFEMFPSAVSACGACSSSPLGKPKEPACRAPLSALRLRNRA